MNIQQMRYVLAVADHGSFHEAAKKLYVSQPSLSHGIKELEHELGAQLFERTRQGNFLTNSGIAFVRQARKIVGDVENLHRYFTNDPLHTRYFSIAGQHYDFIATALCHVMQKYPDYQYLRAFESTTLKVIRDVAEFRSEIGIIFINELNQSRLLSLFDQNNLIYEALGTFQTHIFMRTGHPLADKQLITLSDLAPYPQVRFTQEATYSELAEDPLAPPSSGPVIATSDRATLSKIVNQTDAYGSGSGILEKPSQQGLVARPLKDSPRNSMILLRRTDHPLSEIAQYFIKEVKSHLHQKVTF
ncbi:LysR family transcriptional regulator [Lentilactobacillus raoultii]|uniref:LysR family transcriptional regulator n=1 Tax=Lentilactobacillus raoultii TaxID=1987503 RepID=A0ABW3PMK4_9LACO|nr:LysR family transcriptional regulator [Lentilactobacillus raoultii]